MAVGNKLSSVSMARKTDNSRFFMSVNSSFYAKIAAPGTGLCAGGRRVWCL